VADGKSNLKQTELFYLDGISVTIFPIDIKALSRAESIDFYNVNNPFEAKLIYGDEQLSKSPDKPLTYKPPGFTPAFEASILSLPL